MPLSDRQQAFVTAFLRCGDAQLAARAAGYTAGGARRTGYRLLHDPDVRTEIRRQAAMEELTPLAFLLHVMNDPVVPMRLRSRAAAAAAPYVHERAGK